MIEFGKTLKAAREAKGLTPSQLAEQTHILVNIVTDLEEENFSKIVAPIYGRGFVKLYCEAVGLDPQPLVEEFMEIFSGNRDITIKERDISPEKAPEEPAPDAAEIVDVSPTTAAPDEPLAPELTDEPLAPPVQGNLFDLPASAPTPTPAPSTSTSTSTSPSPSSYRYVSPLRENGRPSGIATPGYIRWAVMFAILGVLLWAICAGISALYRATAANPAPAADEFAAAPTVAQPPAADTTTTEKPRKPRETIEIAPLYID